MRRICIEDNRIMYFGNAAGYITGNKAVADPIFYNEDLNCFLKKQPGIEEIQWVDGVYDRLANGSGRMQEGQMLKKCRIWQLCPDVDIHMKFISYDRMAERFGEPQPDWYRKAYDGEMNTNDLEEIYAQLGEDRFPPGYDGHSLSVSDVVELYDEEGSEFFYVNKVGFKPIAFGGTEPKQGPAMQF